VPAKVEYSIVVDDKGRVTLKSHGDEAQRTGKRVSQSAREMEQSYKKVENAIHGMHNRLKGMMTGLPALLGVSGIVAGLAKMSSMASQSEATYSRLRQVVEQSGASWSIAGKEIETYLQKMKAATTFDDEDAAEVMTTIIRLTGSVAAGYRGTGTALDMVASKMFSAESAAKMVALALTGNVEMLGRYIPELKISTGELDKNWTAAQKTEFALGVLQKRFGGTAAAELTTWGGIWKQFKNYLGDIPETVGAIINKDLAPYIKRWTAAIIEFINSGKLAEWAKKAEEWFSNLLKKIESLYNTFKPVFEFVIAHPIGAALTLGIPAAIVELSNLVLVIKGMVAWIKTIQVLSASQTFLNIGSSIKYLFGDIGSSVALLRTYSIKMLATESIVRLVAQAFVMLPGAIAFTTIEIIRLVKAIGEFKNSNKILEESTGRINNLCKKAKEFEELNLDKMMEIGIHFKVEEQSAVTGVTKTWTAIQTITDSKTRAMAQAIYSIFKAPPHFAEPLKKVIIENLEMGPPAALAAKDLGKDIGKTLGDSVGDAFAEALEIKVKLALENLAKYKIPEAGVVSEETRMMGEFVFPGIDPDKFDIKTTLIEQIGDVSTITEDAFDSMNQDILNWQEVGLMAMDSMTYGLDEMYSQWRIFSDDSIKKTSNDFLRGLKTMANAFEQMVLQMIARWLSLEAIMGIGNMIVPGMGTAIGQASGYMMHTGGPLKKMHGGGINPDERAFIGQVGEYMIPKRSVNAQTYPALQHIRAYGSAPRESANIAIGRSNIVINSTGDLSKSKIESFLFARDSETASQLNSLIENGELDQTARRGL
jgi:hypothetical protein